MTSEWKFLIACFVAPLAKGGCLEEHGPGGLAHIVSYGARSFVVRVWPPALDLQMRCSFRVVTSSTMLLPPLGAVRSSGKATTYRQTPHTRKVIPKKQRLCLRCVPVFDPTTTFIYTRFLANPAFVPYPRPHGVPRTHMLQLGRHLRVRPSRVVGPHRRALWVRGCVSLDDCV